MYDIDTAADIVSRNQRADAYHRSAARRRIRAAQARAERIASAIAAVGLIGIFIVLVEAI